MKYFEGFLTFLCGAGLGFLLGLASPQEKKEISYTQLEKELDQSICQTRVIEAIIAERVRLTGKVNP